MGRFPVGNIAMFYARTSGFVDDVTFAHNKAIKYSMPIVVHANAVHSNETAENYNEHVYSANKHQ